MHYSELSKGVFTKETNIAEGVFCRKFVELLQLVQVIVVVATATLTWEGGIVFPV